LRRQVRCFEERMAGPGIEHRRERHFIFERRTGDRFQCLEWVRYYASTDYYLIGHMVLS